MARDLLRFFQRVHLIGAALVNVQLRDLVLLFHLQHVFHGRFPGICNTFLFRLTNQAHVETGTAAHWRDIDDLNAVAVQVVTHEASEQVLQRMNAFLRHHFFVWHAEAQIEDGDRVAVRGVHGLRHADCRCFHTGMVDSKAI